MQALLWVAIGGAAGACLRYGVGAAAIALGLSAFPWATLAINILGGFAMGALAGFVGDGATTLRLLVGVGVLGGFTTFSAFSLETVRLLEDGQSMLALLYVLASTALSIAACWAGLALTRGAP